MKKIIILQEYDNKKKLQFYNDTSYVIEGLAHCIKRKYYMITLELIQIRKTY